MFIPLTSQQRQRIGRLRDVVSSDSGFLHVLPDLLETQKIPPALAENSYLFAEHASSDAPHPIVIEALSILNHLVESEERTLLPPSRELFTGRYFRWGELGNHTDPQSTISHIINKCVTQLKLQTHHG